MNTSGLNTSGLNTSGELSSDPRIVAPDTAGIAKAASELSRGELVAFPTETVYGLGGDATNDHAVAAIFEAKGRPTFNPLIVHIPNMETARRYAHFNEIAEQLAAAFWPGALTLVLPRRAECALSHLVSAGLDSIAIRIPSHPIAKSILLQANCPIAAPSANRSGGVSPTCAEHIQHSWPDFNADGPGIIVDGGACQIGLESTVIEVTAHGCTQLRPGGLTSEDVIKITGKLSIADGSPEGSPNAPKSPGMLARHYAPTTPVILNSTTAQPAGALLGFGPGATEATLNLSTSGNLKEAAANLFAMLRELDSKGFSSISISAIPETGLGQAINDRLRRAATSE